MHSNTAFPRSRSIASAILFRMQNLLSLSFKWLIFSRYSCNEDTFVTMLFNDEVHTYEEVGYVTLPKFSTVPSSKLKKSTVTMFL